MKISNRLYSGECSAQARQKEFNDFPIPLARIMPTTQPVG
jgi:hypothetical protein